MPRAHLAAFAVAAPLLALAGEPVAGPPAGGPREAPARVETAAAALDATLAALERVREFRDVALAPDGRRVAYTEKVEDADADGLGRVWLADLDGGRTRRISAGKRALRRERGAAFSPDGRRLAFLSDAARPGQLQLYVAPVAGGPARRLTGVRGQIDRPRWSPDGQSIALLYAAGSEHEAGALVAHPRDVGVVAERLETQRLAVVDATSGALREVSPEGLYVYDYDWAPDGARFAAEAVYGSGTNDYWIAELFVVEVATGRARSLWKPPLQIAEPRFAPAGKSIAVIHGLMSDEGSNGGDVWLVPLDGGAARNLTPGLAASAKSLHWLASGEVLFSAHVDGGFGLGRVSPAGGAPELLWSGAETHAHLAVAPGSAATALVRHSFARAPEVWAGAPGQWNQVSRLNDGALAPWGGARGLHWTSDGRSVQGWLLPPPKVDPQRRYPLVVVVHGGPAGAHSAAWPSRWSAVLPGQGYFVLLPNPRGSLGFGAEFAQANVKDFGHGDLRDILAGVDAALAAAPIDPGRVGVVGWSYGGYMAMWAPTQTARFKAAVAGAGIANWQSYYGQNRIDRWMIPFFGASVYDDLEVYARSSPITFIKRHKTPTLVLHGERDSEVPAPQGYEMWHALKALGVPTQLVIYPDEGHRIARREHRRDIQKRTLDWLARWLTPAAAGEEQAAP
jgi:dipeptidyl aminopeptidase/acylaminoacyl peptidase